MSFFSCIYAIDDLMALQGNVQQDGVNLNSGNLTVDIYDALSGGNLIYNSSDNFYGAISSGKYDVMLGNGTQELTLEYGKFYYMEIFINSEKLSFSGVNRQIFQSSIGQINGTYINNGQINSTHLVASINISNATGYLTSQLVGNISLSQISGSENFMLKNESIVLAGGQNVSTGIGGWFKGLFNWIIGSSSTDYLTFNGTTLDLTDNLKKWLYNQTYSGSTYNSTYNLWAYNQTYSGSTYNQTYDLGIIWQYNQTTVNNGITLDIANVTNFLYNYNQTYSGSTYNSSYDAGIKWQYNQTYSGSTYNETYSLWSYNQTYSGSTYNETYNQWAYNQTYSGSTYNSTYNLWAYNQTYSGSTYNSTYNLWAYNQTEGAKTYSDNTFLRKDGDNGTGTYNFNSGWTSGGLSIIGGNLFAQAVYVYNITSLGVSNLNINGSLFPVDFGNTFDIGNATWQWRNGYFGTEVYVNNLAVSPWLYNQTTGTYNQYGKWWYNQTTVNNGITLDIANVTNFLYNYNQTYSGSTYNETYALWAYNQTYSGSTYNETYANLNSSRWNLVNGNISYIGGNVGIGTTTPTARFVVADASNGGILVDAGGSSTVIIDKGGTSNVAYTGYYTGGVSKWWTGTNTGTSDNYEINTAYAGASPYFVINRTNGNVGIGTATPDINRKLTISGSVNTAGIHILDTTDNKAFYLGVFNAYGGGFAIDESGASNRFYIQNTTGYVGIGTTTPDNEFEVKSSGAGTQAMTVENTAGNDIFALWDDATNDGQLYIYNSSGSSTIVFNTLGDSYFNSGNVGIGTASPATTLDVVNSSTGSATNVIAGRNLGTEAVGGQANLILQGTGNAVIYSQLSSIHTDVTAGIRTEDFAISTYRQNLGGVTEKFRITGSGNVGIGTTAPTHTLNVVGNGNITGDLIVKNVNITGANLLSFGNTPGLEYLYAPTAGDITMSVRNNLNLNFDSDGNTAGVLTINSLGTAKLTMLKTGSVGIGTTSPTYLLDVKGNVSLNNTLYVTNAGNVGIGTTLPSQQFTVGGGLGDVMICSKAGCLTGYTGTAYPTIKTNFTALYFDVNNTYLGYMSGDSNKATNALTLNAGSGMTVNTNSLIVNATSGNVGIGAVASGYKLEISSTNGIKLTGGGGSIYSNNANMSLYTDASYATHFKKSDGTNLMSIITATGHVGVNSASPSYMFEVGGLGANDGIELVGADSSNMLWGYSSLRNFIFTVSSSSDYTTSFNNSGTGAHNVNIEGKVGINTTAPYASLDVQGAIRSTRNGYDNLQYIQLKDDANGHYVIGNSQANNDKVLYIDAQSNSAIPSINNQIQLRSGGTGGLISRITISANGTVGINTTTPSQLLTVSGGNINITGINPQLIIDDTNGDDLIISTDASNVYFDASNNIQFKRAGGNTVTIDPTGKVGINTTTPTQKLDVNGNINVSMTGGNITMGAGQMYYDTTNSRLVIKVS